VEILKSADCRIRGSLHFFKIVVCCSHLVAVVVGVIKWLESLREFECLRSYGKGCDFNVCVCVLGVLWDGVKGVGDGTTLALLWHYSCTDLILLWYWFGTTLVLIWYYSGTGLILLWY
jgi:hypothetical protein